jgi:hypothetical protein
MKKDTYFSLDNFYEFFPKTKRFERGLVSLWSKDYISVKKEDGLRMVNITEEGAFALNDNYFRKEQYKFWWIYIKDGLTLVATILMAVIAIIALKRDTSKFVEKEQLKKINQQLFQLQSQSYKVDSQLHIYQTELNNIKKFSTNKDKVALKHNPDK